ncbi:hypothetical protein CEXT_743081 [Caerostris extrusa]|uniref:Uncharacterized protein n=1 Tax=Caerostris extrusa TaxID=172846 RepID=A0AAV4UWY4_CAEEX|nr:hypothetical protein CEXT_743081 [Caerostris extrusa]
MRYLCKKLDNNSMLLKKNSSGDRLRDRNIKNNIENGTLKLRVFSELLGLGSARVADMGLCGKNILPQQCIATSQEIELGSSGGLKMHLTTFQ